MLTETRATVAHHLDGAPWPVFQFLPDDINALPCIAIPRVHLAPHETKTLVAAVVDLLVIGSRIANDDAATELDSVADLVVARFGGVSKSVKVESPSVISVTVEEVQPSTVTIGATEFPCYVVTIQAAITPDC